jgi:hypothetical protein
MINSPDFSEGAKCVDPTLLLQRGLQGHGRSGEPQAASSLPGTDNLWVKVAFTADGKALTILTDDVILYIWDTRIGASSESHFG